MGRAVIVVPIELDRTRHLKFDFNALIALDEQAGISAEELATIQAGQKPAMSTFRVLRDLVWAGLLHEQPSLTREEVGGMLDLSMFAEISAAVEKARGESVSKPEGEPGNPQPPAQTGLDSGQ